MYDHCLMVLREPVGVYDYVQNKKKHEYLSLALMKSRAVVS